MQTCPHQISATWRFGRWQTSAFRYNSWAEAKVARTHLFLTRHEQPLMCDSVFIRHRRKSVKFLSFSRDKKGQTISAHQLLWLRFWPSFTFTYRDCQLARKRNKIGCSAQLLLHYCTISNIGDKQHKQQRKVLWGMKIILTALALKNRHGYSCAIFTCMCSLWICVMMHVWLLSQPGIHLPWQRFQH